MLNTISDEIPKHWEPCDCGSEEMTEPNGCCKFCFDEIEPE